MSTLIKPQADLNPKLDGRTLRANNSRQKIVDAMLALLCSGDISPSAENVANTANVGLRTVFRRFSEMEILYREMIIEVQKQFIHNVFIPFETRKWQEQLDEFLDRKSVIYEDLMPYRVAANFHLHQSAFIRENITKWNVIERKLLANIVPAKIANNKALFNALELILSFDSWIQLRSNQELTHKQATNTKRKMMHTLLVDYL
jgi:hypothetical protein